MAVIYSIRRGSEYFRCRHGLHLRNPADPPRRSVGAQMSLVGKLHPLFVHFPIALVLVSRRSDVQRRRSAVAYRAVRFGAALLVAIAGHLGAALVWGADFFGR